MMMMMMPTMLDKGIMGFEATWQQRKKEKKKKEGFLELAHICIEK